ncbi:aspartate-semialdehyde dehydrogenase [Candidatus Hecatella orcuttiae]|jgi:aspartate-semialdehyde dehydrogenase|uniref:aspartate-semialdehyde dehydrogenase n=1 Tax=Candidatus Hecatella orcuttiae TaxID=1935119 RepID=UPI002867B768|nr:aspartate-semialdehyde dehydrogenase [Candidatus Hecatella orcuttiae]
MVKVKVGVLGATGMVGGRFIQFLKGHPWFELQALAASERSTGRTFAETVKWKLEGETFSQVADMEVRPAEPKALGDVDLVFSALPAEVAHKVEEDFARAGFTVFSNASSHRMDPDVPILNPEVNADHAYLVEEQRRRRKWEGAIITNPNCTTAILTLSVKPILDAFGLKRLFLVTMQALSGAGYPGVPSLDIVDNVIPYISREEEKVEKESLKILGSPEKPAEFRISASCNRVPTLDGHLEAVFAETEAEAEPAEVAEVLAKFEGEPQRLGLPTAPKPPIVVRAEMDRPQPRLDRWENRGMSVVVGRVRRDAALGGVKYLVLGHNTVRGAAGCSILNAELLKAKGII